MKLQYSIRLIIPALVLCLFGLFIINSVSPNLFISHAIFIAGGVILYFIFAALPKDTYQNLSPFFYLLILFGLIILFTQPAVRGAHRWLTIFGQSFQVAEIAKPFYIIVLAFYCRLFLLTNLKKLGIFLFIGGLPILLILKQPDLGNAILYLLILTAVIFTGRAKYRYIIGAIIAGIIFLPFAWNNLQDYQKNRLIAFATPNYDPQGIGYNAAQALIAVGSGQITGRGIGRGTQSHLRFLPESHTDFVFGAATEELGFIGGFALLSSYAVLLYFLLSFALSTDQIFERILIIGIFTQIYAQVFVNIGMNLGLAPITGVTLPLVSYGGSSILSTFISLGIIESVRDSKSKSEIVIS